MMWLEIAILSPSISSSCDFSLGFVQNYIIFVFSIPLLLPLWPRPCEGHQDMQTNFSHSAGVPGKGVCPSEVHVNTTPPSLEVCYTRPPCWLPPRLLPLILVLPTAMACGDSAISQQHCTDAGSSDHYLQRLLPPMTLQKLLAGLHSTCASCLPKESKFQVESVLRLGAQKGMWALSWARTHFWHPLLGMPRLPLGWMRQMFWRNICLTLMLVEVTGGLCQSSSSPFIFVSQLVNAGAISSMIFMGSRSTACLDVLNLKIPFHT